MHREKLSSDRVADSSDRRREAPEQLTSNRLSRRAALSLNFLGRHYPVQAGFILKSALSNSQQQPADESQAGL